MSFNSLVVRNIVTAKALTSQWFPPNLMWHALHVFIFISAAHRHFPNVYVPRYLMPHIGLEWSILASSLWVENLICILRYPPI